MHRSAVDPPEDIPTDEKDEQLANVRTAWRTDILREMTYTQFWILTREGRVDKVNCSKAPFALPSCNVYEGYLSFCTPNFNVCSVDGLPG